MKSLGSITLQIINSLTWLYTSKYGYDNVLQHFFKQLPNIGYLAMYGILTFKSLMLVNVSLAHFVTEWQEKHKDEKRNVTTKLLSLAVALLFLFSFYIQTLFQ
jgi:hypothetical protein